MNKRTAKYLAHAENRIYLCRANIQLWSAKAALGCRDGYGFAELIEQAQQGVYRWIGLAQENHQEDHF